MQIIETTSDIASALSGYCPPGVKNEIHSRIKNYVNVNGPSEFANTLVNNFNDVYSGSIYKAVQAVKSRFNRVLKTYDGINYLNNYEDVQTAPRSMINLIMANHRLKELKREGLIEGYGERYNGRYLDRDNVYDPNYVDVINGMSYKDETGDTKIRVFNKHSLHGNLTSLEKMNVLSVWNRLDGWIEDGIDVTSEDNNTIG